MVMGQQCLSLVIIVLLAIANVHGYNAYKGREKIERKLSAKIIYIFFLNLNTQMLYVPNLMMMI